MQLGWLTVNSFLFVYGRFILAPGPHLANDAFGVELSMTTSVNYKQYIYQCQSMLWKTVIEAAFL